MKLPLFISISILFSISVSCQNLRQEVVEWKSPKVYKTKLIKFKTDDVNYECTDCKILEIKTVTGITGYFIAGNGKAQVPAKNISETANICMLRFNPADIAKFVKTDEMTPITDDIFISTSKVILEKSFRHCYHDNMDALIPPEGIYAINFFSDPGEILVSPYNGKLTVYNFTTKREL